MSDYMDLVHDQLMTYSEIKPVPSNPISITFNVVYKGANGRPVVEVLNLSKAGTYQDYITDVKHDSHGPRTDVSWDPIGHLQTALSMGGGAVKAVKPYTELISLEEALDGMADQFQARLIYYQLVKYPKSQRGVVLGSMVSAKETGIQIAMEKIQQESPDAVSPFTITYDHGVSTESANLSTGDLVHKITFGELYDTTTKKTYGKTGPKTFTKRQNTYPESSELFNTLGCALTMKVNGQFFYVLILGHDNGSDGSDGSGFITYRGKIHFNSKNYPFDGPEELDANIPMVASKQYYRSGYIKGLPQYMASALKYMGDRTYLIPSWFSCYVDTTEVKKMMVGTHDRTAFAAFSNISRAGVLNSTTRESPTPIPCGFFQRTPMPNKIDIDYNIFAHCIPRILNGQLLEQQQKLLEEKQKNKNLEKKIAFFILVEQELTKLSSFLDNVLKRGRDLRSDMLNFSIFEADIEYIRTNSETYFNTNQSFLVEIGKLIEKLNLLITNYQVYKHEIATINKTVLSLVYVIKELLHEAFELSNRTNDSRFKSDVIEERIGREEVRNGTRPPRERSRDAVRERTRDAGGGRTGYAGGRRAYYGGSKLITKSKTRKYRKKRLSRKYIKNTKNVHKKSRNTNRPKSSTI